MQPVPSAESAYSQFLKWDVSSVMYWLRRIILTMALLLSDISEKHCMKYLNISVWKWMKLTSISLRE